MAERYGDQLVRLLRGVGHPLVISATNNWTCFFEIPPYHTDGAQFWSVIVFPENKNVGIIARHISSPMSHEVLWDSKYEV